MMSEIRFLSFGELNKTVEGIDTDTLLIVVDQQIWNDFKDVVEMEDIPGKRVIIWKAPSGEKIKNFDDFAACMNFFLEKGVHRKSHLLAIGGGSISDFAGFIAATILRGIRWSIIPTTLLSVIDASIGGKVGINSEIGKNLIGAFHLPENIYSCPEFLNTLGETEMNSGKGELIKYCFLDKEISDAVLRKAPLLDIIKLCAAFKQKIVTEDPKEGGIRKALNLGHTLGHGIEKVYSLPHGISVIWGMAVKLLLFERHDLFNRIKDYCEALQVNLDEAPWHNRTFKIDEVIDFVKKDKKKINSNEVCMVDVQESGKYDFVNYSFDSLKESLEKVIDEICKISL